MIYTFKLVPRIFRIRRRRLRVCEALHGSAVAGVGGGGSILLLLLRRRRRRHRGGKSQDQADHGIPHFAPLIKLELKFSLASSSLSDVYMYTYVIGAQTSPRRNLDFLGEGYA